MEKLDFNTLYTEYCVNFLNEKEIALKYNLTEYGVKKLIKEYVLKRDPHKAHSIKNSRVKNKYHNEIKNKITKDALCKWYISEDHDYKDAPIHFGISRWQFDKLCKEYGIKKDRKKTILKSIQTREKAAGGKEKYKENILNKQKRTIEEKYGSLSNFYTQKGARNKKTWKNNHEEILNKAYVVKKHNNSFNSSAAEKSFKKYLIDKYGEADILTNYSCKEYPFRCNFYIKSKNLFIELNLHWSHGFHAFNPNNPNDINMLTRWKKKAETSEFYKNAIITWTIRDVEKRKIAVQNHLNYYTIYSAKELEDGKGLNY